MKYYLHDTNAFNDEKVSELFLQFGYEGVGLFYTILERIAAQEKPIKTAILKRQLFVGKKLEKCWRFMEEIGIISSNNGETFNERILSYSQKYQIQKEKNKERVAKFREELAEIQGDKENVTHYTAITKQDGNAPKVKVSKVKEINIPFETFWELYGKKEGRMKSEAKWKSLTDKDRQQIIDFIPAYKEKTPDVKYRKNPMTFFNARTWEDEIYTTGIKPLDVLKAVAVNENDQIVYENGKIYAAPKLADLEAYRQGKAAISIFDRKIS